MAYDTKAQEFAFQFYAKGISKEKALREIKKVYPGFSGSTWDEWVEKLQWRERRAAADMKLREFEILCRDTARALVLELNEIRENLLAKIRKGDADTQTVYAFTSTAKQIADLTRQQLAAQDPRRISMEVLMQSIEKLLAGLREMAGLAKPLEANATAIGELVTQIGDEFGAESLK
jgi:methyl-accepting chemotaxis protein